MKKTIKKSYFQKRSHLVIFSATIFMVTFGYAVHAATTLNTGLTTDGTVAISGPSTFTFAGSENIAISNTTASVDTLSVTANSADNSGLQSTFTLGNNAAADYVSAFEANVTSASTGDADFVTGLLVNNLTSPDATVNEMGIYQKGSSWDYGLWTEDTVFHVLPATGSFNIVGNADYAGQGVSAAVDRTDDTAAFDIDIQGPDPQAVSMNTTVTDDTDSESNITAFDARMTNNSGDTEEVAVGQFRYLDGAATTFHANASVLRVEMNDSTTFSYPKLIMLTGGSGGGDDGGGDSAVLVGIDASDVDIVSAMDIGKNFLKTTDLRFFQSTNSSPYTLTLEEVAGGNDLATFAYNSSSAKGDVAVTGTFGIGGGTAIAKHLSTTSSIDNTNVAANTCESFTAALTGVAAGDTILATPGADGATTLSNKTIVWSAFGTANTINLRVCNPTASALGADPSAVTWRFDVWQH